MCPRGLHLCHSRTKIMPGSQSRSEKMVKSQSRSQSRTNFVSTPQPCFERQYLQNTRRMKFKLGENEFQAFRNVLVNSEKLI